MRYTRVLPVWRPSASERLIPRCAVTAGSLHLDELVVVRGALGLACDRRRESGAAKTDHGLQGVRQSAQMSALALGELGSARSAGRVRALFHGRIVYEELMPRTGQLNR